MRRARSSRRTVRALGFAIAAAGLLAGCSTAPPCLVTDGREMVRAELFFGRDGVDEAAWTTFVREDLTAAFPDGLTVLAGEGQWRDPRSGALLREPSRIVLVLLPPEGAPAKLATAAAAYRRKHAQQSVGVSASRVCARF